MKLLLFDIDGTLLEHDGNGAHARSFSFATKRVFDTPVNIGEVDPNGKTDSQILVESLLLKGIKTEEALKSLPLLFEHMSKYFKDESPDLTRYVMPGAASTLAFLKENQSLILAILSGNVDDIAWTKLKSADLAQYFEFGAFGNEALKRSDLVALAVQKAKNKIDEICIIGDTERDIICARDNQCIAIILDNPLYKINEKNKPDFLIKNFSELKKLFL